MAETLVGKELQLLESVDTLNANSVLSGLSKIPNLNRDNVWVTVPLFLELWEVDQGSIRSFTGSNKTRDTTSIETDDEGRTNYAGILHEIILQHLNCEQLSMQQSLRRRIAKFQFSWYQFIPHSESEKRLYPRKYSGRLYRDGLERSLQLESLMVSDLTLGIWLETNRLGNRDLAAYTRRLFSRLSILDPCYPSPCLLLPQRKR